MAEIEVLIPEKDVNEVKAILAGEGVGDPAGWTALLNTYNKLRRPNESLLDSMKRQSSAYRGQSPQYLKYKTSDQLNNFEFKVNQLLENRVRTFIPDPNWAYTKHESPTASKDYNNDFSTMVKVLQRKWGNAVDYRTPIKVGQQYYFKPPSVNPARAAIISGQTPEMKAFEYQESLAGKMK